MSLVEILIAIFVCEEKITKLEKELSTIGANPISDIKYWMEKKEGLELLMEQTVRAINIPKSNL